MRSVSILQAQYDALFRFSLFFAHRAHTQMGRLDEARTIFSQGIEAAGMAGEALHSLLCSRADVLHRLKRLEECIEDCTRAIRYRTHCASAGFQSSALNRGHSIVGTHQ